MDIEKLRSFCELVKTGNLHDTENLLKVKYATLRKRVLNLEKELGFKLIENQDNKIVISEEGEKFYSYANDILNFTDQKLLEYEEDTKSIGKSITIATTNSIAALWLTEALTEFNAAYPEVQIAVKASDESFDLLSRDADVSISTLESIKKGLKVIELTNYQMNLYASESYIKRKGMPKTIEELRSHTIIGFGNDVPFPYKDVNWHLKYLPEGKQANICINSGVAIYQLVENGVGIGSISQKAVSISPVRLIRILPDLLDGPNIPIGFCFPETRASSKTINILYEYIKDKLH
ncbi:MAG: LysR family transcriptional regulator [Alphaproteobacteria bacterium]|jgi:DNA-binding transcriptional LysR family regulator|nr:LysR family transcriptional regulator [Alphaproteobacteria bacterium]